MRLGGVEVKSHLIQYVAGVALLITAVIAAKIK